MFSARGLRVPKDRVQKGRGAPKKEKGGSKEVEGLVFARTLGQEGGRMEQKACGVGGTQSRV